VKKLNIWDILLFPRNLYKRLNDNKVPVFIGAIIVGIVDVFLPLLFQHPDILFDIERQYFAYNMIIAFICAIVIGTIDIMFFAMPLFDFLGWLERKNRVKSENASFVKFIKIYLIAHILVIPINIILSISSYYVTNTLIIYLLGIYFEIIMPIWFSAIIYKGVSTIYNNLAIVARRVSFIAIFLWNTLLSYALSFIIDNLLFNILK
jgi:hypothetical protein